MSFSIVIPVHKNKSCLADCLESVFQNLEGDEIVLVENGISDNFWEVCINYSDKYPVKKRVKKRLKAFFHSENVLVKRDESDALRKVKNESFDNYSGA